MIIAHNIMILGCHDFEMSCFLSNEGFERGCSMGWGGQNKKLKGRSTRFLQRRIRYLKVARSATFDVKTLMPALGFVAPCAPVSLLTARCFILRAGLRPKGRLANNGAVSNAYFAFRGRRFRFDDSVDMSFTHGVLKRYDTSVLQARRLAKSKVLTTMHKVALVTLIVAARDHRFSRTLVDLAVQDKFDIFRLPFEVAKKLGVLRSTSLVAPKRSTRGGNIKSNYDLASRNLGKCASCLNSVMALLSTMNVEADRIPGCMVEELCDGTTAKHLLFNHLWSALDHCDLLDHSSQAMASKAGGNSDKFRRLCFPGANWDDIAARIKTDLKALGHDALATSLSTGDINALTCQALRVLRNFALPGVLLNWRDAVAKPTLCSKWERKLRGRRPFVRKRNHNVIYKNNTYIYIYLYFIYTNHYFIYKIILLCTQIVI